MNQSAENTRLCILRALRDLGEATDIAANAQMKYGEDTGVSSLGLADLERQLQDVLDAQVENLAEIA